MVAIGLAIHAISGLFSAVLGQFYSLTVFSPESGDELRVKKKKKVYKKAISSHLIISRIV